MKTHKMFVQILYSSVKCCSVKCCSFGTDVHISNTITLGVLVSSKASAWLKACSALWLRRSARAVWASRTIDLNSLHKLALPSSTLWF